MSGLEEILAMQAYHVVHHSSHGVYDREIRIGYLLMVGESGMEKRLNFDGSTSFTRNLSDTWQPAPDSAPIARDFNFGLSWGWVDLDPPINVSLKSEAYQPVRYWPHPWFKDQTLREFVFYTASYPLYADNEVIL